MRRNSKEKNQQQRTFNKGPIKKVLPNQTVLDSIGSPNAWTPETEEAWLEELDNIPRVEIYRRYPPMKKPNNVSRRGKSFSA